jgi:hypothetical protein
MEKGAQMNKLLNQIELKEFPTMTDFEGVAIVNLFAEADDAELEKLSLPVIKTGNELVFVGPELDCSTRYYPDRARDFSRQVLNSALWHASLHQPSFASRYIRKDTSLRARSLKKGIRWRIDLFKYAN